MTFVLSSRTYWPTAQLTVVFTAPVAISTRFPGLTLTEPLPLQVTPALKAQVMFVLPGVNAPACMAVNETNGGGYSTPIGTITTTTTVVIGGAMPWIAGDIISYICVSY